MALAQDDRERLIDRFESFFRTYLHEDILDLASKYPRDEKSLWIDFGDLQQFDSDLADDYLDRPESVQQCAEQALRRYDIPANVGFAQAHVRVYALPGSIGIREIRAQDVGTLVSCQGIVRKATSVRPKILEAAFECQRCGTMTRIPQSGGGFQEPHECQGCERQGPFRLSVEQSEFVDAQKLRIQESPEGLRGGETPQSIDINIEDDITGRVTPGDHVTVVGILHLDQQDSKGEKSAIFDVYMEGVSVVIEDEEFDDIDIEDGDVRQILDLAEEPDIYEQMVDSIAPSIYGHESAKFAMALQLFSGVTKHLPDGTRIRGDLHMLLIGDPGTGKSAMLQYIQKIAPRSVYTSGKGSSAAGLCVTGDTLIHTDAGFQPICELARAEHPAPVSENTAAERQVPLYTYDQEDGSLQVRSSSLVWRMPEKPCRQIETRRGKILEASTNTPVLTCRENGIEWTPMSAVTSGDYVAIPKYREVARSTPKVTEFLEFTNEKVKLESESIAFLNERLVDVFGSLRDAASELNLSEDFIYSSLKHRFVSIEKLDRILDAVQATREDVTVRRAMLAHGNDVRIPRTFDEDLLYLVGLVFGDGNISVNRRDGNRGMVRISNGDERLLQRAVEIIRDKFDVAIEIERQENKVPYIRLYNATIARFFENLGMATPKESLRLDPRLTTAEHADAFLRGLYDADGSVSARESGGSSVQFSTISEELAEQVQLMLETYGVYAKRRARDRRGTFELANGQTIESKNVQVHVEIYGKDVDVFAERIGFDAVEKQISLTAISGTPRRDEVVPVGPMLMASGASSGTHAPYLDSGSNPGRDKARTILSDVDLGSCKNAVEEAVRADLCWDEVVSGVDTGEKEVYDLTVPGTHNFVGNGIVTHNTAAAVRDDFAEGSQWTLEAGALVLADGGIAAIDELDKMNPDDRSAMHEGLEQQEISISKAGINATLKSRCSLLGAANPKYGRFDQYESIGEQIDLEPALVSRFDLIFTMTDRPDAEKDRQLAEHIVNTNYAGELHTQRTKLKTANVSEAVVADATRDVTPSIDPRLLRKYVAYARRTCYPTMTKEAREAITEFYVNLRSKGQDEDAPVPVTARKLEALVRLSEASARIRLSDSVERVDAERVIEIVRSCLQDIGVDPETGEFDADIVETGRSKTQRDRVKDLKALVAEIEQEFDDGAPVDEVVKRAESIGIDRDKAEHEIEKLKRQGELYEPGTDLLRTT